MINMPRETRAYSCKQAVLGVGREGGGRLLTLVHVHRETHPASVQSGTRTTDRWISGPVP